MSRNSIYELVEHIKGIWVIDTHEHLPTEEEWLAVDESRLDFSQLMHYIDLDVVSAGMPFADMQKVRFADLDEDEKWALFEPFWQDARNTTFARVVEESVKEFYGVPGLDKNTYKEIGRRIKALRKPGHYRSVLMDTARIRLSLVDTGSTALDPDFFRSVVRLDDYFSIGNRRDLDALEEKYRTEFSTLAAIERALGEAVEGAKRSGAVAIKTAQAYSRGLKYEITTREAAEREFDRVADAEGDAQSAHFKALSDYLFCRLIENCIEHDLPVQVHTGMAAGHEVYLEPTNPTLLTEVILHYPQAKFDLFHAGFPYWEEMGVMAKAYPNVRADLCWMHIVSPAAARRALDEWLELAPANKIFGFGGDLGSVEIVAIHAKLARSNIAQVLAEKVDTGYFSLKQAKRIAELILRDNPMEFFRLEGV